MSQILTKFPQNFSNSFYPKFILWVPGIENLILISNYDFDELLNWLCTVWQTNKQIIIRRIMSFF
jgi:hypothetical protein